MNGQKGRGNEIKIMWAEWRWGLLASARRVADELPVSGAGQVTLLQLIA